MSITESKIVELVDDFYGKIRADSLLGPIFTAAIGEDWGPHLTKMYAFWSTAVLASRTYKGNPMMVHLNLPRLTQEHFSRWLALWRETVTKLCDERSAEIFAGKAEMIAERLLHGITAYHGAAAMSAAAGDPR